VQFPEVEKEKERKEKGDPEVEEKEDEETMPQKLEIEHADVANYEAPEAVTKDDAVKLFYFMYLFVFFIY
jgi:hypothetical protein